MLKEAMNLAERLQALLDESIAEAAAERSHLATLDPAALQAWASSREARNHEALRLERELLQRLAAACGDEEEPSLELLRQRFPAQASQLDRALARLRDRAGRLRQEDELTRTLVQRSRIFVDRYLGALAPGGAAYDRRGHSLDPRPGSTLRASL